MISAVTAYVPLPGHPRNEETYRELGRQLMDTEIPLILMEGQLEQCWMHQYLQHRNKRYTHSVADNPRKNSISYLIVQAQKSEWLVAAAEHRPDVEVFVWIDFGIFSVPGVNGHIIQEFLLRAMHEQAIAIPGCWDKNYQYDDSQPCWRFCGGVMVVPRQYVMQFDYAMKREYVRWLEQTNNLSWEVNTLARVEKLDPELPLWWFKADHDATMFTSYQPADRTVMH
ncbi:MAG TPA: hypothetical protein VF077_12260 [Nitrospiraceae bacterium]